MAEQTTGPTRLDEHPFCAYDLDCYHSQVMAQEQAQALEHHLESCEACVTYLEELATEEASLFARLPVDVFAAQALAQAAQEASGTPQAPAKAPGKGWTSLFVSPWLWAATAACCALLVWRLVPPTPAPVKPTSRTLRTMGHSPRIKAYIKSGTDIALAGPVAHVREGDAVRLKADFPARVHLVIFFLDVRGKVSWFLPEKGTQPPVMVKKGPYTSPGSIVFDHSPLTERVFVYWQVKPFAAMSIVKRVKRAWEEKQGQAAFADAHWLPKMERLWSLPFVKR